jgi:hypothetical protein
MRTSGRIAPTWMVVPIVVAAILGYLAGHGHSRAEVGVKSHTIFAANVRISYPTGWQPAVTAPAIPGLAIAHPVVLAPSGGAAHAGLLIGELTESEPSPLPRSFMAHLTSLPETEVVELTETQAYRYTRLSVRGSDRILNIYAIPNPGGSPTALVCYASAAYAAYMRTCGQIVAKLTLAGQQPSYGLAPQPAYARKLSASIAVLDGQRVALRREMHAGASPLALQRLAARLAAGFAGEAASLSSLKPPSAMGQQQVALTRSILRARDAYSALAVAASAESPSRSAAAQTQVYEAETGVNAVLENFALLGYRT